ncbi:thiamine-phosphate kinase [Legionella geestiana]|uniref:thiamine-phosphate kinase n=1 Tax=Legionella geestiana TaxID=45065 RepID=UPI001091FA14|nr:thiamine-phosphate kinase [Legionella geestiana]QDQ39143.1 thiamine-phosphate kinase [Legionella geestiana]
MDEFALIETFFKRPFAATDSELILGIGDDGALLKVPPDMELVVCTDTLVEGVHFPPGLDAGMLAERAVRVNVSDLAAMGATPRWASLALTLPALSENWMKTFSQGLCNALTRYGMTLIGGDTTRGPLCITLTVQGLVPSGRALRRSGAASGNVIVVTGMLGAAALAVECLHGLQVPENDRETLMQALLLPEPRVDVAGVLRDFATAAIDVSDGLGADLHHLCRASGVGACLMMQKLPVHPLVQKYASERAMTLALEGGDDYVLCFTVPPAHLEACRDALSQCGVTCYPVGYIEDGAHMRLTDATGTNHPFTPRGYNHFQETA